MSSYFFASLKSKVIITYLNYVAIINIYSKRMSIISYFDIRKELEDFDVIHSEIEKGIVFKGTNLWILMCAILVASVGLNMNSTAVIIGAMLISPLMGPINGMGV